VALRAACLCLSLLSLAALPVESAQAQSAVQSTYSRPPARSYGYPSLSPYRSSYGWRLDGHDRSDHRFEEAGAYEREGPVRTLCVRMCDGFYFPISSATVRSELARDADRCSAMCSVDAQLFYHSTTGGSIDTMVDLTGRAYGSFPNAFKYRKTLVPGCRCRPQPWSEAERRRHRSYEDQPVVAETRPAAERGDQIAPLPRDTLEEPDAAEAAFPRRARGEDQGVTVITSDRLTFHPQPIEPKPQGPPPTWYPGLGRWGMSPYR
jgi:hypothetical protein